MKDSVFSLRRYYPDQVLRVLSQPVLRAPLKSDQRYRIKIDTVKNKLWTLISNGDWRFKTDQEKIAGCMIHLQRQFIRVVRLCIKRTVDTVFPGKEHPNLTRTMYVHTLIKMVVINSI